MANKRKKGKKQVRFWFTEAEREILAEAAKKLSEATKTDVTMTDFVRMAMMEVAKRYEVNTEQRGSDD